MLIAAFEKCVSRESLQHQGEKEVVFRDLFGNFWQKEEESAILGWVNN